MPGAGSPKAFDRYAYALNNPISFNDPTGHWPDWFDTALGAAAQYFDDTSFGALSVITGDLDYAGNSSFQQGRGYGRMVSIVQISVETVVGAYATGAALATMGPTAGGGLALAPVTGGSSATVAAVAVPVEAVVAVGGVVLAGHGAVMMAKINNDPVPAKKGGGENPDTIRGKEAHNNYPNALGDDYVYNRKLPSGKRPDAIDWKNNIVRELKPDNPRAIGRGFRQVQGYANELSELTGRIWRFFVDTYKK